MWGKILDWQQSISTFSSIDDIADFAKSVDLYEAAHNEPPRFYLHCLPFTL